MNNLTLQTTMLEFKELKIVKGQSPVKTKWVKGEGLFLDWGVDFQELDSGVGSYSTAIILLEDGTVKSIPVENIKFTGRRVK